MEFLKPSTLNVVWAEQGQKIKPDDSKILQGWVAEIPPYQMFNWAEHRRDVAIAHINQHGIPTWDAITQYKTNKSYVQGSNGVIYRAVLDNVNRDPVTDTVYWKEAFFSSDSGEANKEFVGYSVQGTNFTAQPNTRYYVNNPITVTLPLTAGVGDTITLNKRPKINPTVTVISGVISTPVGDDVSVTYDVNDEINFVFNGSVWEII